MKNLLSYLTLIIFAVSCTPQPETKGEDFCDQIHRDSTMSLSGQIAPVLDSMKNKTGVYVLEEGDVAMISRAWLTEYAEKTIDIQYFIFSTDNVGLIACDYLLRAADRGVKVRILVDDFMVDVDEEEILALDHHPNISIKIYNPSSNLGKNLPQKLFSMMKDFKGFNQRMHNKTFIVDEKIVITGGRNIADEYFDYDHEYNFRDRDVLLMGGVTKAIQSSFEVFWNHPISSPVTSIVDADDLELNVIEKYNALHQYACNSENFWPQVRENIKNVPTAFELIQKEGRLVWLDEVNYVSDYPGKNHAKGLEGGGVCTDSLIGLINQATHSVTIQTPYLVTSELTRSLLRKAVERGVTIKILTNSLASTDNLEAFNGYQRDRQVLLKTGVKVYEFKPDAAIRRTIMTGALQSELDYTPIFGLHAKSMVIDNKVAVIGTFNLDPRSAHLNTECVTIIRSDEVAEELQKTMEEDMQKENAWETTLEFNPDSVAGVYKQLKAKTRQVVPKSIL